MVVKKVRNCDKLGCVKHGEQVVLSIGAQRWQGDLCETHRQPFQDLFDAEAWDQTNEDPVMRQTRRIMDPLVRMPVDWPQ